MNKLLFTMLLSALFVTNALSQTTLLTTGFEGPGFDEGWTIGVSQAITEEPRDYPTGLDPWEKWAITASAGFGYVHSGDSAAWIGGTLYYEPTHDWLMTPQIEVPVEGETQIYYWLWYHSEEAYVNKFYIMIYDIENAAWEQGYLLANAFNSPYHYIEEYTFDLSPWKGKQIKIAFVKNGTYQMAMDDIRVVNTLETGVSDCFQTSTFVIYPNPSKDIVRIDLKEMPLNNELYITDLLGNTILSKTVSASDIELNISELSRGIYLVRVGSTVQKLTIQ